MLVSLKILYWKDLQEHDVFLHGHGDYEKIR